MGRSKYGNVKTVVDGMTFDSHKEAMRYEELFLLQHAGIIAGLQCQVRFPFVLNGYKIADYVADFYYRENTTGALIVEDCKGMRTQVYRLKAKMMLAFHGVTILET